MNDKIGCRSLITTRPERADDPSELAHRWDEVDKMAERERAHRGIDRRRAQREPFEVTVARSVLAGAFGRCLAPASRARLSTPITSWPSSARKRAWRPVPQAASSAAPGGSSARIARTAGCLHRDERVAGRVVGLRPRGVSGPRIALGHVHSELEGGRLVVADDATDLLRSAPRPVASSPSNRSRDSASPSTPTSSSRRRTCRVMLRTLARGGGVRRWFGPGARGRRG